MSALVTGFTEIVSLMVSAIVHQKLLYPRNWRHLLERLDWDFGPNMVMWWPTCNYNTCTRGRRATFLILLMMGAWRLKHVEWLCRNKTCTVLHQVGVLFDFLVLLYTIYPSAQYIIISINRLISFLPGLPEPSSWRSVKQSWKAMAIERLLFQTIPNTRGCW